MIMYIYIYIHIYVYVYDIVYISTIMKPLYNTIWTYSTQTGTWPVATYLATTEVGHDSFTSWWY